MKNKACVRCGKCCSAMPCGIALCFFGDTRPCPALETNNEAEHACGLVIHASIYIDIGEKHQWKDEFLSKLFSHMLGIGYDCCSSPEKEMLNAEMRKRLVKL